MKVEKKYLIYGAIGSTCFLSGFLFSHGYSSWTYRPSTVESIPEIRDVGDQSPLINPLLECTDLSTISNKKINQIRDEVQMYVTQHSNKSFQSISVYFRDLNNGPWFGIDEKKMFIPGSLLKVPLMISVYKAAMADPSILKKEVVFNEAIDSVQSIEPEIRISKGQKLTVEQLVERMIKYSDNDAAVLLYSTLNQQQLIESYTDLGIQPPTDEEYTVSVKNYASFFRILYNATYLDRQYSQKALELLTQTAFHDALVAGVPPTIKVAHKFGERGFENSDQKQLHDCGIVYYPNQPYLLCIMTRGNDFEALEEDTAEISRMIYQHLARDYKIPVNHT